MAIKLPDPGNGIPEQKTGNDEWTNMKIVRDNFADRSNAASRLVGTEVGDVTEMGYYGVAQSGFCASRVELKAGDIDKPSVNSISSLIRYASSTQGAFNYRNVLNMPYAPGASSATQLSFSIDATPRAWIRVAKGGSVDEYTLPAEFYTTANATKDGNGFLKAASPVVDLYDDHIDLNGDAKEQGIEFVKNGKGDYTLKTKTGLRSDNTWRIEIPHDDNRNPLFAVDIDAKDDGTINIKCYKRIFNMQTFLFEPDFKEPMDINEGRFISVRLNDNPDDEVLDEPTI